MPILVLTLCIVLATPVFSHGERRVTVQQAIQAAMDKNHSVIASVQEASAATEEAKGRKRRLYPRVVMEENAVIANSPTRVFMMKLDEGRFSASDFAPSNLNDPAAYHDFRTALTLDQPLFDLSLVRAAALGKASADISLLAAGQRKEDIAGKVYSAWMEVRRAKANLVAAEKGVAEAREHLRLAIARGAAGTGLKSDELRAKTFLLDMERGLLSAENDLKVAKMQLGLLMGDGAGSVVDITDDLPGAAVSITREEWLQLARENRQDLKALAKTTEQARLAVVLAKAAYFPTVNATASYQLNDHQVPFGRDKDSWQAGLSLRWELFSGLTTASDVAKQHSLQRAAEEYRQEYEGMVAYQVDEALLRYEETQKRHEMALLAVIDAEESVRLISKRFANALSPLVDVLDAQSALNRARANLVDAENGQALAVARVWQASGVFLREALK